MTMDTDTDGLLARVQDLEHRNEELRLQAARRERAPGARWRPFASAALIVVAAVLVPASIVGAWARVQLTDEEAFVATLSPLIDAPAVQQLIADETMGAVRAHVDFRGIAGSVVDGMHQLAPGASTVAVLDLLEQPLADGLDGVVTSTVSTAIRSDAFADAWEVGLRGAHRALTVASTSDGAGIVRLTSDGLGISLGQLVDHVRVTLVERGVGVAVLIPAVDRIVIIGDGESLLAIRVGYAAADLIGWWLPVTVVLLFAAGVAVARRRRSAVLGVGIAVALGSSSLVAVLWLAGVAAPAAATSLGLPPSVVDVVFTQLVADMRSTAWSFAVVGIVLAIAGWLSGRSRGARMLREAIAQFDANVRRGLRLKGVRLGRLGSWLAHHRKTVRLLITLVAVAALLTMTPLVPGDVGLVAAVGLVFAWLLELIQVRPEEAFDAESARSTSVEVGVRA